MKCGRQQQWLCSRWWTTLLPVLAIVFPQVQAISPTRAVTQLSIQSWTQKQGLVWPQIWSLAQSSEGYLWIGTNNGLIRYDGVRFTPWLARDGEPLSGKLVQSLCAARDGSLWIGFGASGGIARLVGKTVVTFGSADGVPQSPIFRVAETADGTMWAASMAGLLRYKDGVWRAIRLRAGSPDNHVLSLFEDSHRVFWVGTDTALYRRLPGADSFQQVQVAPVQSIFEDDGRRIWIVDRTTGPAMLQNGGTYAPAFGKLAGAATGMADRGGNVWVAVSGVGLLRFLPNGQERASAGPEKITRTDGLASTQVNAILEDREGNIWAGSEAGLTRIRNTAVSPLGTREGLPSDNVTSVAAGLDGALWIGSRAGLTRISKGKRRHFTRRDGLPDDAVLSLYAARNGDIWVGAPSAVAVVSNEVVRRVSFPANQRVTYVNAITEDTAGGIWLAAEEGVLRWNGRQLDSFSDAPQIRRRRVNSLLADQRGRVWIGLPDGIAMFEAGAFQFFGQQQGVLGSAAMYEQGDGTLWFAGRAGLSRFRDGRFTAFTHAMGIPTEALPAVADDRNGNIWLATNSGVLRIGAEEFSRVLDGRSRAISGTLFDAVDGLRAGPLRYGHPGAVRDLQGLLWFITAEGLAAVDPGATEIEQPAPPVLIESMSADGTPLSTGSPFRPPPRTHSLEIEYIALNLATPEKTRFRYRLEGFDSDWVEAGARRQALYTNLPPATYRFAVRASRDGVLWTSDATVADITVEPAFVQTSLFRVLCIAMGVLAAWGIHWLRIRAMAARLNALFEVRAAERARIARELHDTLLQGLSGVAMHLDVIERRLPADPEKAKAALRHVLGLADAAMAGGRRALFDVRASAGHPTDLATALVEGLPPPTNSPGPVVSVETQGRPRRLNPAVHDEVARIGREAASNALRHANATRLDILLRYDPDSFCLSVTDNGAGIDPGVLASGRPGHFGLMGMRERAEAMGARLTILSRPGAGTQVALVVTGSALYLQAFGPLVRWPRLRSLVARLRR